MQGGRLETVVDSGESDKLASLQEGDLVVLAECSEARDVFRKLHHILHGLGQSDSTVLPHLIHCLRGRATRLKVRSIFENILNFTSTKAAAHHTS